MSTIENAKESYHRLILLVGENTEHDSLAREISQGINAEIINVNLALSKHLLSQTVRQRKLYLSKSMNEILPGNRSILLDRIEILFDVELGQDPLRLLESLSRNQTVVAFWNGQVKNNKLIYAEQGHKEYRTYDTQDLSIIEINNDKVAI